MSIIVKKNDIDNNTRINNLIILGKKQGHLIFLDIINCLDSNIVNLDKIYSLIRIINKSNIKIYQNSKNSNNKKKNLEILKQKIKEKLKAISKKKRDEFKELIRNANLKYGFIGKKLKRPKKSKSLSKKDEANILKRIKKSTDSVMFMLAKYPKLLEFILINFNKIKNKNMKFSYLIHGFHTIENNNNSYYKNKDNIDNIKFTYKQISLKKMKNDIDHAKNYSDNIDKFMPLINVINEAQQFDCLDHINHKNLYTNLCDNLSKFKWSQRALEEITSPVCNIYKKIIKEEKLILDVCLKSGVTKTSFIKLFRVNKLVDFLKKRCIGKSKKIVEKLNACSMQIKLTQNKIQDIIKDMKLSVLVLEKIYYTVHENRFKIQKVKSDIINAHIKLVISLAKKNMNKGLRFADLVQEGNIGLMRAINKFEYTFGYKLSTYATWWVWQGMSRAIADQGKTIRIPVHMTETINKFNRKLNMEIQKTGIEPSVHKLSKLMKLPVTKIDRIIKISKSTISLDASIHNDENILMKDLIKDDNLISTPNINASRDLNKSTNDLLSSLTTREASVLKMRFGIQMKSNYTLEEVGKQFNVTRERVRQVETRALRKLRQPSRVKQLRILIKKIKD